MSELVTRKQVIELIDTLPKEAWPELAEFAEFLRFKLGPRDSAASPYGSDASEQSLLKIIQRRLEPDQQTRLDTLRQKNETGSLTQSERDQLLTFVEQIEKSDAERAQALIELARLRNAPVAELIQEFAPERQGKAR